MEYSIITNNPTVAGKYVNVVFVEGTVEDVLVKTRNLVQSGNSLITHPLPASIRMMYTPYRSIIVGNNEDCGDRFLQLLIAEESITKYKRIIEYRNVDYRNKIDYEKLDEWLLINALHETKIMEVAL
ncbi:MAG: GrdX family protein [Clostridiaceae bacterium]